MIATLDRYLDVQVRLCEVHNKSRRPCKALSFTEEEEEVQWKVETTFWF